VKEAFLQLLQKINVCIANMRKSPIIFQTTIEFAAVAGELENPYKRSSIMKSIHSIYLAGYSKK